MRRQPASLSDQLREAIRDCGRSRYKLSKETGISQALLSRFMNGKAGLSIEYMDKLGEALSLTLMKRKGD